MLPVSLVDSACDIIETARPMLVDAILTDLYQKTFWQVRYDDYGREYARTITHYHLNNLITALKAGEPAIFADYWAWKRPVMLLQGACTHHLHEFIDSTARPVARVLREGFPLAEPCFAAAHRALEYEQPACQALNAKRKAIIDGAAARLCPTESERASYRSDVCYHLSYLEDAAVMGKPQLFHLHTEWVQHTLKEQGRDVEKLNAALQALKIELEQALEPEVAAVFTALLQDE